MKKQSILLCLFLGAFALPVSAQIEDTWSQAGSQLTAGEMDGVVVDESGIHLAPTGEVRNYTEPDYTVEVREIAAVYTSTVANIGSDVVWLDVTFTHSGLYYDDLGEYDITFEVRTGHTAVPNNNWSDWSDLTPSVATTTCAVAENPYETETIDGTAVDLMIPGGRMTCFPSVNLTGIPQSITPYLQYRFTVATENDETNVTINDILFSYEITDSEAQGIVPLSVSTNHIHTTTFSLTLTLVLILTLIGLTYGTYLDIRIRR